MDFDEPVISPFPMSEYGTGCAGSIKRATEGGSWWGGVSLVADDIFLLNLGLYPPEMVAELKKNYRDAGFHGKGEGGLRHSGSVDEIGRRALATMRKISPRFFDDRHSFEAWSPKFGATVRYPRTPLDKVEVTFGILEIQG